MIVSQQDFSALDAENLVRDRRAFFRTGATHSYRWRVAQLRALRAMLITHGHEFEHTLLADVGKGATEAQLTEISFTVGEIDHTLRHLRRWLRPRRVAAPVSLAPARARIIREPLGVALIIGPWNYPLQLLLVPLLGALAAGNTAVVKPSEMAPATSALLARLVPRFLDARAVSIVEGAVPETTALLAQRFDHIFYTGNAVVGRIVARAAAEYLTPTTLELGGKSPVFIDESANLRDVARRLIWGKMTNAGQTCVAPDYVLASPKTAALLLPELGAAITEMYGLDPAASPDYGRIVNRHHFDRLGALLSGQSPQIGGESSAESLYVAPTVINGADPESAVMAEEIFGPILPIVHVAGAEEAIEFINAREKPLALYLFSESARVRRHFLRRTSSGGVGVGIPIAHLTVPGLPFGGVGQSGHGAYHGEASITTFSHEKSVLIKGTRPDTLRLIYPPYTLERKRLIAAVMLRGRRGDTL
ncbi:aldehyde dehydrogenase family protein [Mycetocola spongiae]|uniref:aldehyde dehydrogenase family protein n=1 Tax=Mycetocola spongiae TaxID=2859226 RepID=UPI001CF4EC28|nr:aldehyde dehydrogenase family protein [Mycetocola spongiae]UCR88972.1 aldehyde dehydrogenase family protein [Mycetocola spongiae]